MASSFDRVCVSLPASVLGDLRRLARATGRPVSALVRALVERELADVLVVPVAEEPPRPSRSSAR